MAVAAMKVSKEMAMQYNKYVSLIGNEDCERSGATSTVNFEKHVDAFKAGKRN